MTASLRDSGFEPGPILSCSPQGLVCRSWLVPLTHIASNWQTTLRTYQLKAQKFDTSSCKSHCCLGPPGPGRPGSAPFEFPWSSRTSLNYQCTCTGPRKNFNSELQLFCFAERFSNKWLSRSILIVTGLSSPNIQMRTIILVHLVHILATLKQL